MNKMDIVIKKLTPDLAEDYASFFDVTPHDHNVDAHKCYCVCWCNDDYEGKDFSTREKRRNAAIQYVNGGNIQGYLAYHDDKIIGWCNANTKADCLKCCSWRRQMGDVPTEEESSGIKVKSVFCFTISPDMKRKGVATQLLERVCRDAADEGFDFVEAYSDKEPEDENINFGGSINLYKKCGFTMYCETKDKIIMRKALERRIEDHIAKVLTDDAQKNALDFTAFLRANDMQFERSTTDYWADKLYWYVKFQDEFVGFILINGYGTVGDETEPEGWIIWSDNYNSGLFADFPLDERAKEIAWNHVDFGTCGGGITVKLFGKEFAPVCNGTTFRFNNPNAEVLECVKKLVELRKKDILNKAKCEGESV